MPAQTKQPSLPRRSWRDRESAHRGKRADMSRCVDSTGAYRRIHDERKE